MLLSMSNSVHFGSCKQVPWLANQHVCQSVGQSVSQSVSRSVSHFTSGLLFWHEDDTNWGKLSNLPIFAVFLLVFSDPWELAWADN